MKRLTTLFLVMCFIFILFSLFYSFAEERITLTTYYPAPYGVYREMRVDRMSVGPGYRNVPLNDGELLVNGSVGIGTTEPQAKLQVQGSAAFGGGVSNAPADNMISVITGNNVGVYKRTLQFTNDGNLGVGAIFGYTWTETTKDGILSLGHVGYSGVERALNIKKDGNVGIGTTAPEDKLHIYGNLRIGNTPAQYGDLIFDLPDAAGKIGQVSFMSGGMEQAEIGFEVSTGGGGNLIFGTGQPASERVRITKAGNVGIGTTEPSSNLHIYKAPAALGFDAGVWIQSNFGNGAVGRGGGVTFQNNDVYTGGLYAIRQEDNWKGALTFYTHKNVAGNTFGTTFTEKMRIQDNGNVGIGTSAPTARLEVWGAGNTSATTALHVTNSNNTPTLVVRDDRRVGIGTTNLKSLLTLSRDNPLVTVDTEDGSDDKCLIVVGAGDYWSSRGGRISLCGNESSYGKGAIHLSAGSVWPTQWHDGAITFSTNDNSRLIITRNGDVGVGTGTDNVAYRHDVAGIAHATSFQVSSDARFKTNIGPLTNTLDKINQIHGVAFDWNEIYERMGRATGHREIGLIAQDVEVVFPELVTTWGQEQYRAIDYGRLTAVLLEAIKELRVEVQVLRQRMEVLERRSH